MRNLVLERTFAAPLDEAGVHEMARLGAECMQMHEVAWQQSLLAADGTRLICHFTAPDVEALRTVMRTFDERYERIWPGTLHPVPESKK